MPTDSEQASSELGQPYYLANLAIETSRGLQQFQGLPPDVTPTERFAADGGIGNTSLPGAGFAPTENNVQFNSRGYDMGGCMGCHGVA